MKPITIFITLLCLTVSMVYGQDMVPFVNDEHGFSVEIPADWTKMENRSVTVGNQTMQIPLIIISPLTSHKEKIPGSINILVEYPEVYENKKQYLDANLLSIKSSVQGTNFKKPKEISINGLEGYLLSYVTQGNVQIEQYIFFTGGQGLVVTAAAEKNRFNRYKKVFNKIIASFKLIPREEGL